MTARQIFYLKKWCKPTQRAACTRPSEEHRDHGGGSLRVFKVFARLDAGSVKVALSHPTHQRVTRTLGQKQEQ